MDVLFGRETLAKWKEGSTIGKMFDFKNVQKLDLGSVGPNIEVKTYV